MSTPKIVILVLAALFCAYILQLPWLGLALCAVVPLVFIVQGVQRLMGKEFAPRDHFSKKCRCGNWIHTSVGRVWDNEIVCPSCYSKLKADRQAESSAYVHKMLDARRDHDPSTPPPRQVRAREERTEPSQQIFCINCGTKRVNFQQVFCQECGTKFDEL